MPALLGGTGIIGKDIFVKMKAQKSASIQTASGTVVTFPQSEERAFSGLSIYGHSTQDGTPTPENPVPIVSTGDSGEINVAVSGKNLIPFPYLSPLSGAGTVYEVDGVTYTVQADGGIKCVGTPTSIFGPTLCRIRFSEESLNTSGSATNGKVTLSGGPLYFDSNNNATFIYWDNQIDTPVDMTIYPQIEYGTVATAYEPYKTPQTLTLSTPGGLPGIPVDASKLPEGMEPTYVDESGQAWVCDEVDFERGVHVQRVIELDFDGAETWSTWGANNLTEGITGFYSYVPSGFQKVLTDRMLSNLLQYAPSAWGGGANGINVSTPNENQYIICSVYNDCLDDISTDDAAIESWKNILNTNNLHVMLVLQDPIETDLTAEEIAAYKALHTYTPNTSVGNDAEAWMKVGYNEFNKRTF